MASTSADPASETTLKPKILIITMFDLEAQTWHSRSELKFDKAINIPGLNPKYPDVLSTEDGDVCLLTTGESMLNAALAISTLINSERFDFSATYFLISGIAGVNPKQATLGSVTFARYAVQVDLQYEFDAREIPSDWKTGYVPQGASNPGEYPTILYGTEVYEVNNDLKERAIHLTKDVVLEDSHAAAEYRKRFAGSENGKFDIAAAKPSIIAGDVASSNVFFHGHLLAESFEEVFSLLTNGAGKYSMTNQEDNATLGALLRAALQRKVDFSRIIVMRSASNFDRSISESKRPDIPLHTNHGGLEPSLENLYRVGVVVIKDILQKWDSIYQKGILPKNYIGDIFGALGGTPGFGPSAAGG